MLLQLLPRLDEGAGLPADALAHGLVLSDAAWRMSALEDAGLHLALGHSLPDCALRELFWPMQLKTTSRLRPAIFATLHHSYRKLSRCVDHVAGAVAVEAASSRTSGAAERGLRVLRCIEGFAQDIGQWLKVAGGDKARVTEAALQQAMAAASDLGGSSGLAFVEFGAFVGYSTIRFALCALQGSGVAGDAALTSRRLLGASFEVDPVHAAVARHFLDLAGLASYAEVWLGLLQDALPLVPERTGEASAQFIFMDQRGTTFHEDMEQIERLRLLPPGSSIAADNVLKPGAPVFLWNLAQSCCFHSTLWSMGEFASEAIEDWQAIASLRQGQGSNPPG